MNEVEIVKALLSKVDDTSFKYNIYSSDGFDGWNTDEYIDFSAGQLLYLIKSEVGNDELFTGFKLEEVDLDSMLSEVSMELSWPDGYPSPHANSVIPAELETLAAKLEKLENHESVDVDDIRTRLEEIQSGEYTFDFSVRTDDDYYFSESNEKKVELERREVLGLLLSQFDIRNLIEERVEVLDEDFINEKVSDDNMAEECDPLYYGGSSEDMDAYLQVWSEMIKRIMSGEISEVNAMYFTEYLEEGDYERDYDEWLKEKLADEE